MNVDDFQLSLPLVHFFLSLMSCSFHSIFLPDCFVPEENFSFDLVAHAASVLISQILVKQSKVILTLNEVVLAME